jgi:hypothetical protein
MSRKIVKWVLCSLVAVLVISMGQHSAFAQLPPPLSPWLRMENRPRSGLGNYLDIVKPQQNYIRSSASQASQIQSQQQALQSMLQAPVTSSATSGARNLATTVPSAPTSGAMALRDVLAPPQEIPSGQYPARFNQYLNYYPPYSMQRRPVPNFSQTGYSTIGRRR